ncbi:hypothetical protein BKA81DRAFT_381077 [Phyllosticta paracitricarpa]
MQQDVGFGRAGGCQLGAVLMKGFAGEMVKMLDCGGQGTAGNEADKSWNGGRWRREQDKQRTEKRSNRGGDRAGDGCWCCSIHSRRDQCSAHNQQQTRRSKQKQMPGPLRLVRIR